MERKYWVPALEKANAVLEMIAGDQGKLKFNDLLTRSGISKSTLFSLLQTLEGLGWVSRDDGDVYSLGRHFGIMGNLYFQQFDLIRLFRKEAGELVRDMQESIQLARLDDREVLYLDKVSAPSPVQMVAGPGAKFPAHATALGKVLLTGMKDGEIRNLYGQEEDLPALTPYTKKTMKALLQELAEVRKQGFAYDLQEGAQGFSCIAAPVRQWDGQIAAAVSMSILQHHWEEKKERASSEIRALASRLSLSR